MKLLDVLFGQVFTALVIDNETKQVITFKMFRGRNQDEIHSKAIAFIKKLIKKNKIIENQKYEVKVLTLEETEQVFLKR